jgi:hypothetical protein
VTAQISAGRHPNHSENELPSHHFLGGATLRETLPTWNKSVSGRGLGEEGLDFRDFPRAEAELGRPGHAAHLVGPSSPIIEAEAVPNRTAGRSAAGFRRLTRPGPERRDEEPPLLTGHSARGSRTARVHRGRGEIQGKGQVATRRGLRRRQVSSRLDGFLSTLHRFAVTDRSVSPRLHPGRVARHAPPGLAERGESGSLPGIRGPQAACSPRGLVLWGSRRAVGNSFRAF